MLDTDIPLTIARALRLIQVHGSVSEAARSLGVSQPAVSKGIAQLEKQIGCALIRRGQRPVSLTEEGAILALHAEHSDHLQDRTRKLLKDAQNNRSATVRLGSFGSSASFHILPRLLSAFAKKSPGTTIEILEFPDEDLRIALEDGLVDLAIIALNNDTEEHFETAPALSDQLVALVPSDHRLAQCPAISPQSLADMPFIMTRGGSAPFVEHWFRTAGVHPRVTHRILQVNSIVALVAAKMGVSVVAQLALPDLPDTCRAIPLAPKVPRLIGFAKAKPSFRSHAAETFWQFCRKMAF